MYVPYVGDVRKLPAKIIRRRAESEVIVDCGEVASPRGEFITDERRKVRVQGSITVVVEPVEWVREGRKAFARLFGVGI